MRTNIERWLRNEGKIFLEDIGIKKGQTVLDFGCGSGHYTIPSAKVVGERGKVYAVEKDKEVLDKLMEQAKSEGLKNIKRIDTSGELKIPLEGKSCDVALLYDVLHYMDVMERNKIYNESHRVLKTDALLSVYPKHNKLDEPLSNLSDMQLEDIIEQIENANFYLERKFFKKLIHDENYNMGCILNFRKSKEG
ncbi:MAG: class I SAM-dependent methyltransferase [Methanophagales archaeon]|nr:class I SAM-dependent methyltransferase [Methanophagales archaeon]